MKYAFRYLIKRILWILLHFFWIIPVDKKKIYFVSYKGMRYACNPKYLYLKILQLKGKSLKYVWSFLDVSRAKDVPEARVVKTNSFQSIIQIMTSKIIIMNNNDISWFIPLRKQQILVETWHGGGAYKKTGLAAHSDSLFEKNQERLSRKITHYVSSCAKFTEIQSKAKLVPIEKFINTGMPRNEIFFHDIAGIKKTILNEFGILKEDIHIVLFAPTYRTKPGAKMQIVDFCKLQTTLQTKFGGEWKIFYRAHNYTKVDASLLPEYVVDVSAYDDMQELLYVSDVLITDYSSCMWDFALTGRPCFLYMPDLDDYKEYDRDFFTSPDTWAYPYVKTEEELYNLIMDYDEKKSMQKIKNHLDLFGSYENANSCELVLKSIGLI